MKLTRRDFGKGLATAAMAAALPLRAQKSQTPLETLPSTRSTFKGVTIGANTYSLPQLPIEDAIKTLAGIGFGMAELHPSHVEPKFGAIRRTPNGPALSPEQVTANGVARQKLREWRLTVPLETFQDLGKKFKSHNLYLYSYNMNFPGDDFTDGELDRSFQMTRALGCNVMTAVGSKKTYARLAPYAEKYKIWLAVHNEANSIPTIGDFDDVLRGANPYVGMTLDIGHFVASNSDPVSALDTHHTKIYNLHIKDRKKNGGPNMPFGQGDTPIKQILSMDRDRNYHIPAHIEWEVAADTSDARVQAVRQCFEYCKAALLQG
jgi:sugar phosphate isomerase/epimerase